MTQVEHHTSGQPAPQHPDRDVDAPQGSSTLRLVMLVLVVAWVGLAGGASWLIIISSLVAVITLHELGHYLTARAAGMKVTEFFIGFGPRVWSMHRGETEYGIKAIPAGAYVKVIGMTNLEDVDPADESRTYRQKPYWRRMSVAVAGSAMHFAIALVAMFVLFVGYGTVDEDVWVVGRLAGTEVDGDLQMGPAAAAGVEVGDTVLAIGGVDVRTWDDTASAITSHDEGEEIVVTVERGGQVLDIEVVLGDNGSGAGFLGVGPEFPPQSVSPLAAAGRSITGFGDVTWQSMQALAAFFSPSGLSDFLGMAAETTSGTESTVTGSVPAAENGGNRVLSIYGAARLGAQAAETGVASFLSFMVVINIFIGVFNLVPLLPLDGGHVAVATYEKLREVVTRSRVRYHADVAKLLPLTYVVIFVLVSVGLVALYLDIADPIDF